MSSYGSLRVGKVIVSQLRNSVGDDLLAAFRNDMLKIRQVSEYQYYVVERKFEQPDVDEVEQVEVLEFRAPGRAIADRLDMTGVNADAIHDFLNHQFSYINDYTNSPEYFAAFPVDIQASIREDRAYTLAMDAEAWVRRLASSADDSDQPDLSKLGSRTWLLRQLDDWDERFALRAVLLAFPDDEVILEISDLVSGGGIKRQDVASLPSDAVRAIGAMSGMHAPVVVLTEGSTDAEFLKAGLALLFPHLTDLVRFLDYETERRPEGGASALIRMVRAFAAAGISNRIVAVFDNDAAAADCLRAFSAANIPKQVQVIRYPDFELGSSYPTLGPPTVTSPLGSIALANVNGLAASIELYLGKDVLKGPDGALYPIQWKSFLAGIGRYQGEVTHKDIVHKAFRAKCRAASDDPALITKQDWQDMRLVLESILTAAKVATEPYTERSPLFVR